VDKFPVSEIEAGYGNYDLNRWDWEWHTRHRECRAHHAENPSSVSGSRLRNLEIPQRLRGDFLASSGSESRNGHPETFYPIRKPAFRGVFLLKEELSLENAVAPILSRSFPPARLP
jgi:hypothetical protein